MTNLFEQTASRLGWKAERHERYIALARILLMWERAWPALWPASGVLGLYIAAALFGLTDLFPAALRALVCFAVLCATGFMLVREFRSWRMPRWEEGARRVERDSALLHRPITERGDRLVVGAGDNFAESLWRAHVAGLLTRLGRLRLALPSPGVARKDPYSLRYLVLALVAIGVLVAGADRERRLALAFTLVANGGAPTASLDAWITPPAYTGWAPMYLRPGSSAPVAVPQGSELVLRVHGGGTAPHLQFSPEPSGGIADFAGRTGSWGTRVKLTSDAEVNVQDSSALLGRWRIKAIADQPPVIAFAAPPGRTERDALKIAYTAGDDYGVVAARAIIRPVARNAHGVLSVDLPLSQPSAKTVSETAYRDLTAHPFAGLDVEITLEAKDGAGQIGRSKPVRMRLPERIFTNPLARALIEQRQQLATDAPNARTRVAAMLDALAIAPQRFYARQPGIYLGLRATYWTLRRARSADEIVRVEDLLWQMANALEQGGLYDAAARLRAIAQLLNQALAQGAPPDTINSLLQRYQEALQKYLQALAQNGSHSNGPPPPGAKVITPKDIAAMLKAIRQLAQTGARGKAQELLAMLENMLENMRSAGTSGAGQGDKALSGAMQGLSGMIGKQRALLDKSLRQGEGAGDPKDGGGRGLANRQGQLRQDLDRLLKGLSGRKVPGSDNFDSASRAMGQAQGALGRQDFNNAGQAQKNALEDLKNAAGQLAQALAKETGQGKEGQDPLGRASGANGGVDGNVKLPGASELKRARAILEELRRRAAQPGRPKQELDYIDRLLKDF
ncbi:MAG: TIGR02302 family protein [Rhizomicrobium sp.]